MTTFERRLAKIEEIRRPDPAGCVRVIYLRSPDGMIDLAEQHRWAAEQRVAFSDPASTKPVPLTREERTLCVHFVRCSPAT